MKSQVSLPISIIRGGTSRGAFIRDDDLPLEPGTRASTVLRLFGGEAGTHADGIGGEHPILRKVAIVKPMEPVGGLHRVGYSFAQVDAELQTVSFAGECGNLAAGVPLFASMEGWCPTAEAGSCLRIDLLNTGLEIRAEWQMVGEVSGDVSLTILRPADGLVVPLGEAVTQLGTDRGTLDCSVVHAIHYYIFVESRSLGILDPTSPGGIGEHEFAALEQLQERVTSLLSIDPTLVRSCLVAPGPVSGSSIRCAIVYPNERRTHPAFAVTGAATVAVAVCVRESIAARACKAGRRRDLTIHHAGGTLDVRLGLGSDGLPFEVSLERSTRLILRGTAH